MLSTESPSAALAAGMAIVRATISRIGFIAPIVPSRTGARPGKFGAAGVRPSLARRLNSSNVQIHSDRTALPALNWNEPVTRRPPHRRRVSVHDDEAAPNLFRNTQSDA